jgi:hypothetical protein
VTSPDGRLSVTVPPGTFSGPTQVTIAGGRTASDFGIGSTAKNLVLLGNFGPSGLTFNPPVTVTFTWQDTAQEIVSGTSIREKNLKVFHNGVQVAGTTTCGLQVCGPTACCDQPVNTWVVRTSGFSEFAVGTDPCSPMAAGAHLTVTKVLAPAGDDGLTFKGAFLLTPPVGPTLDPVTHGFEVRLVDQDSAVLDTELPAGAYNPTTRTGWKVNGTGTKWSFVTATPAGTGGIFKAVLTDKSAKTPGLVTVQVKGKAGSYGVSAAVEADVVLLDSGQCFAATWPQALPVTPRCVLKGTTLKCK